MRQIEINNLHTNLIGCILREGLLTSPSLKRVQYVFCVLFKTEMLQCIKQLTTIKLQRYWNTDNRVWERTIVLPVHCKDKIKITKVWGSDRPGYWGDLNPPLLWSCSHPWVCLITLDPRKTSLALIPSLIWINVQKSTVTTSWYPMVPAESMRNLESSPRLLTRVRNTASAAGLRQMFPVHKIYIKRWRTDRYICINNSDTTAVCTDEIIHYWTSTQAWAKRIAWSYTLWKPKSEN